MIGRLGVPIFKLSYIILLISMTACQLKPTKSYVQAVGTVDLTAQYPVMKAGTVLVDARSPLETGTDVVSGAVPIWWQDFSMPGTKKKGLLDEDLSGLTKRLALKGIDRDTPVLVLGNVLKGHGEDGRVAWMLRYLGVKDVQIANIERVRRYGVGNYKGPENRPFWLPTGISGSDTNQQRFMNGMKDPEVVVLDVRSPKEFAEINLKKMKVFKKTLKAKLINLAWDHFFVDSGESNKNIKETLLRLGVREDQSVFVISQRGVRSAAATFALINLGFVKAENFMAGYEGIH